MYKQVRLRKIIEEINKISSLTRVGLYGGEFFESQLIGVEKEWKDLIKSINKNKFIESLQIYATLINHQYFLFETLDLIKKPFLVCTSYDEVGRFHTPKHKQQWLNNVNNLHNKNIGLFCTTIPTKEFIISKTSLPDWLGFNLNGPVISVNWWKSLVEEGRQLDYHNLITKSYKFNLPTREEFLQWCLKNKSKLSCFTNFKATHSDIIYEFDEMNNLTIQTNDRFKIGHNVDTCGHPYTDKFYADSDKCAACDALEILNG